MATSLKNLSDYNVNEIPSGEGLRIGIVLAEWNLEITGALLEGAVNTLKKHGLRDEDILVEHVPGSFELPLGAQLIAEAESPDAVICLGAVIRGDTPHFEYVASEVTKGIALVSLEQEVPVSFGILTTENIDQAIERAGSKSGNKGWDAAVCAIEMVNVLKQV